MALLGYITYSVMYNAGYEFSIYLIKVNAKVYNIFYKLKISKNLTKEYKSIL